MCEAQATGVTPIDERMEGIGPAPSPAALSSLAQTDGSYKKRKRARAIQACERCRSKKYKCDESYPACSHCKKVGISCRYTRGSRNTEEGSDFNYIRTLESQIDELTARLRSHEETTRVQPSTIPTPQPHQSLDLVQPLERVVQIQPPASEQLNASIAQHQSVPSTIKDAAEMADCPGSPHDSEITDVNQHTNEIEFYGNTSSMAFLSGLENVPGSGALNGRQHRPSIVSDLYNPAFPRKVFQPSISNSTDHPIQHNFYFAQAHVFIEAYFSGIHYMHPCVDKEYFLSRANALWFGHSPRPPTSFIAMYLSLLALGALTRTWPEERLGDLTRFEWSRKLSREASTYLDQLHFSNDLETVHCLYFMAKICQNELSPHLSWMYLGRAIRTSISAGFNRETQNSKAGPSQVLSRTWWSLFSLEIETSFTLGRADTLGLDDYHNRSIPEKDKTEFAIIPCMVDFARIVRKISIFYTAKPPDRAENMGYALQLENELDTWLHNLPSWFRPDPQAALSASALREPEWCQRDRLVLEIRYHNVKMALFRGFIDLYAHNARSSSTMLSEPFLQCANKCITSAQRTIEIMYKTFRVHVYFRSWWYNTTYIMIAAAALLSYIKKVKAGRVSSLARLVEMAVEILDAMDESVVARKCAEIVRRHLEEVVDLTDTSMSLAPLLVTPGRDDGILTTGNITENTPIAEYQFLDFSFEDMASMLESLTDVNLF